MSESTFCLVFEGKIIPGQDLAEVKKRLQKAFNKDAQTIEKMFSGKKIKIKQGLQEEQARQYQAKMNSIGVVCEVEAQPPKAAPAVQSPQKSASPMKAAQTPVSVRSAAKPTVASVGSPIVANVSQSYSADPAKAMKLADIDKAFSGMIQQVELPASYKAGVVAMGVTMVLLPLIYVGLIALVGYGVLSHMASNTTWMQSLGAKFGLIAYATPIVAGITIVLFMIKPLFAKPAVKSRTVVLDPIKEPVLFHFVNKIATAVGAPRPKQIEVDCEVNASASFRKGLFSFMGDDLVLTIGLPLMAGFSTKQLAGVLAHEFGHFSQGVGMRFHYLAYKINSWLFYSVYARDSWDEKLDKFASEADNWAGVILNIARGGVWLTRKLLHGFMMAGHAVSSYMLRQMEFDADRYEAQVAGSEQFKNTCLQLQRLGAAYHISHDYLAQAWEDKKLVNDFPSLVAHNASQLPAQLDKALLSQMEESKTQMYDSHPSDRERIENASRQQAKGICSLQRPSRDLFKRFDLICKEASQIYYAHELGLDFDASKLVDINQVVKIAQDNEKQQEAYHTYFKDMLPVFDMPLSVNIFDTSKANWDDLLAQYKDTENQLVNQISNRRTLMKQAEESSTKYQIFTAIYDLDQAGFILFPEWFDLNAETLEAHKKHMLMHEQSYKQAMEQLRPLFEVNDRRMSIALTLLNHPIVLEADPDHAQHLKIRNRFSLLINNIKRNANTIVEYRHRFLRLVSFLSCVPGIGQKPADFPDARNQLLEDLKQSQQELAAALHRLDYPYVAEGEHQTIAEYLDQFLPRANQFSNEWEFYIASGNVILEKLDAIYGRVISGLANVALTVDQLIPVIEGKAPMPEKVVEPVVAPVVEQFEELVEEQVEEQPVEIAKAVGAEDFTNNASASFSVQQASESKDLEDKPVEKPAVLAAAKDKFAGTRSSFAIDLSEPESTESKQEEPEAEEPAQEKPALTKQEDKSAGIPSTLAIAESTPESVETTPVEPQLEEPVQEKPAFAVKEDKNAGKPSVFAIDESAPDTVQINSEEAKVDGPAQEEQALVVQADKSAGTPSIFTLEESQPNSQAPAVEAENVDEQVSATPVLGLQSDWNSAASLTSDESEKVVESSPAAIATEANTLENKNPGGTQEVNVFSKPAISALEMNVEAASAKSEFSSSQAESPAIKSSNPFLSRSAFSQKLEQDSKPAATTNDSSDRDKAVEESQVQPQNEMPKTVNPFLANISTYQAKLKNKENESQNGGGATISMDGLNAGSMPSTLGKLDSTDNASNNRDKLSSFSTGGLSLEPMTTDSDEQKSEMLGEAKAAPNGLQSVVVQSSSNMIPTDNRQTAALDESAKPFFTSPGLPNSKDASNETDGESSQQSTKPFTAKTFGSDDEAESDATGADSSAQENQPNDATKSADKQASANHRPGNH